MILTLHQRFLFIKLFKKKIKLKNYYNKNKIINKTIRPIDFKALQELQFFHNDIHEFFSLPNFTEQLEPIRDIRG